MTNEELKQIIAHLEEKLAQYEKYKHYTTILELEQDKKNLAAQLRQKEKDWQQQALHYKQTIQALKIERRKKIAQIASLLDEKNKLRAQNKQLTTAKNQLQQASTAKQSVSEQKLIAFFEQISQQLTSATKQLEQATNSLQQQAPLPSLSDLEAHTQDLFRQSVIVEKQLQAKLSMLQELEQQLQWMSENLEE